MSFTFPGQQTVTKADPAVRQQGRTVEVRPAATQAALAPGAARKVALAGRYTGTNPLPVEFRLGDAACRVQVSGVAGSVPATAPATKAPAKPTKKKATVAKAGSGSSGTSGGSGSGGGSKAKAEKPAKPGKAKGADKGKGQ